MPGQYTGSGQISSSGRWFPLVHTYLLPVTGDIRDENVSQEFCCITMYGLQKLLYAILVGFLGTNTNRKIYGLANPTRATLLRTKKHLPGDDDGDGTQV